ncbi:NUDIX hydrolase [Rhodovulum sp. DZ06]|uniref:NUDIX hydrolase n=1 Tax=Rhodovulum sp. DZ06 TaxID=3425126 RepID=UPI003D3433B4
MTAETPDAAFRALGDWEAAGPLRAAVVILHDPLGRVLMQLRDDRPGVAYPGTWAPFGGGVEGAETLPEAAAREVVEELGIALRPGALSPFACTPSDLPGRRRIYAFSAPFPGNARDIRLGEGAGFAFFTHAQLGALPLPPHIALVMQAWTAAGG